MYVLVDSDLVGMFDKSDHTNYLFVCISIVGSKMWAVDGDNLYLN